MSETSLETTGKSVEDAIEKGLARLGLPRDAVEVQVLREGSRGLLGLGGEEAVVRLTPLGAPEEEEEAPEPDSGELTSDLGGIGQDALETLLKGMGLRAHVQVLKDMTAEDDRAFVLNIVGDDLGILIGRRGETLRDLEYLTRLLVAQKSGKPARLVVDVEGYRTRRERVLNELVKRRERRPPPESTSPGSNPVRTRPRQGCCSSGSARTASCVRVRRLDACNGPRSPTESGAVRRTAGGRYRSPSDNRPRDREVIVQFLGE